MNEGNQELASYLRSIPRLTNEAIETAAQQGDSDCVIDAVYPGRPLVISFNYYTQQHEFDFFGRIRKLEERAGGPFNRIYLRDSKNAWYQYGLKGLGESVHAVARKLQELIRFIQPSEVITFGQSMGGYAALLYGILLQADRAIGFGSLSHLDAERTRAVGDKRWLCLIEQFNQNPPLNWYPDLVELALSRPVLPQMYVVAGVNPDGTGGLPNMDKLHTARFAQVPGLKLYEFPEARHEVSLWLLEKGLLDEMLYETIVAPAAPHPAFIRLQGTGETQCYAVTSCTD